jgi:AraC-like DNA-binding protein
MPSTDASKKVPMPFVSTSTDLPFTYLSGGYAECDQSWEKPATALDQCYKIYFLVEGFGRLRTQTEDIELNASFGYFIPGYQLIRQSCPKRMNVHWIHFVPSSLYLTHQLSRVSSVHRWTLKQLSSWKSVYTDIGRMASHPPRWFQYRVQAMLMDLTARVMQLYDFSHMQTVDIVFEQLQPAISYMEEKLLDNPKLEDIAKVVHLAPNYFHRKFTRTFAMTPFAYMLRRRLDVTRQLLLSTDMTVKQIAHQSGFESQFYLSRVFKREYGISPSKFRQQAGP